MSCTCYKLFQNYEDAKSFCFDHKDAHAHLTRATDNLKSQLQSTSEWCVKWYQRDTYAPKSKEYWRNQKSTDDYSTLFDMARVE